MPSTPPTWRASLYPDSPATKDPTMSIPGTGITLIEAERLRQQHIGYDLDHDLEHAAERLHQAGYAYLKNDSLFWPWDESDFKPRNHLDNLIRAGALYLAANDRADHTDTTNYQNYAIACGEQIDEILTRAHEILGELS